MKLYAHQTVAEAITLMNNRGLDSLPVYDGNAVIGKLCYHELREFIDQEGENGGITAHKLHFNLATVLPILWTMRIARHQLEQKKQNRKIWITWLSSAAVVTFVLFGLSWLLFDPLSYQLEDDALNASLPDSSQVILTLTNGKQIALNSAEEGLIMKGTGLYYASGKAIPGAGTGKAYRISTPKNGFYRATLPDGTKAWLNASSSLQLQSSFDKGSPRQLLLSGEGYFEVAKLYHQNRRVPFKVLSKGQEIEVLGTHFDVRAYPHEESIKTTLLEGSVRIKPAVQYNKAVKSPDPALVDPLCTIEKAVETAIILKPNQQAVLTDQQFSVKTVDVAGAVAWTKDEFTFRNMPLEKVLDVVASWHDMKVVYQDNIARSIMLGGSLQKSESVANVLNTLELTANVRFKVQGKQIMVFNRKLISYK